MVSEGKWTSNMDYKKLDKVCELLEKDFAEVRAKIMKAIESCPKKVTLKQALNQIAEFDKIKHK